MKKKISVVLIATLALVGIFFAFTPNPKTEWTIDKAHSKLTFSVSHLMVSEVDGRFNDFDAKITSDNDEDFSDAIATMTAQVKSIDTDNEKRDADLRSANYFDAVKYPTLSFKSRSFTKVDENNYKVNGDITIHGITKPIELNALCRRGANPMSKKEVVGFKVTGKLNRLDFAVGATAPQAVVGNEIQLQANVEFTQAPLP